MGMVELTVNLLDVADLKMKNIFVRKRGQLLVQHLVVLLLLFFQILKDLSTPLASAPI